MRGQQLRAAVHGLQEEPGQGPRALRQEASEAGSRLRSSPVAE